MILKFLKTDLYSKWQAVQKQGGRYLIKFFLSFSLLVLFTQCSNDSPPEEEAHDRVYLMDLACVYKFRDGKLSTPHHPVFCRAHKKLLGLTKDLGAYWTEDDNPDGVPCKIIFIGTGDMRKIKVPENLECDPQPIKPVVNDVLPFLN